VTWREVDTELQQNVSVASPLFFQKAEKNTIYVYKYWLWNHPRDLLKLKENLIESYEYVFCLEFI
jgi:hypothetical protein